jgi:hypothetical protein
MKITIHTNNSVTLEAPDGAARLVGRIDRDSYQMPQGPRGKTTFSTGPRGAFDRHHEIPVPLYVPAIAGSVSSWQINPNFTAAVAAIVEA